MERMGQSLNRSVRTVSVNMIMIIGEDTTMIDGDEERVEKRWRGWVNL